MSAKKDHRKYDRELRKKDRDSQLQIPNPERLRDKNHRMDKQTNDVQGEVSYDENTRQGNQDSNRKEETQWKSIKADYRKRYPEITDDDVNYNSGEFDAMTGRIAKRTNRNREDVNNEIRDWNSTI